MATMRLLRRKLKAAAMAKGGMDYEFKESVPAQRSSHGFKPEIEGPGLERRAGAKSFGAPQRTPPSSAR
jgi:hypothetical protein